MSNDLTASVAVNKTQVGINDKIRISVRMANLSSEAITIMRRPKVYAILYIKLYDRYGGLLKAYRLVEKDISPPRRSDFVELSQGEGIDMFFEGVLVEDRIVDTDNPQGGFVEGVFLNLGDSAILIPSKGSYKLGFEFEMDKELNKSWEKSFGFTNLWHGKLESNRVSIVVL